MFYHGSKDRDYDTKSKPSSAGNFWIGSLDNMRGTDGCLNCVTETGGVGTGWYSCKYDTALGVRPVVFINIQ